MSLSLFIAILITIVAIISGANQILQFIERLYGYHRTLKQRKVTENLSIYREKQKVFQAPQRPTVLHEGVYQGSYRKGTTVRQLPEGEYDIDITLITPGDFKKNLLLA